MQRYGGFWSVLTITVLRLHVHDVDLSGHISGMFVPEVTSGKIQCHLDTEDVLYRCVCVGGGWKRSSK